MTKIVCLLLMMFGLVAYSCHKSKLEIVWSDDLKLPSLAGGTENPGLAGAFSGISNDHLIVFGGANFPEGLPWEGGKKVYHNEGYVYAKDGDKWNFKSMTHLPDAVAYGASVEVSDGILCLGGENEHGITNAVHLLSYDPDREMVVQKPFLWLPVPLTNLSAVRIDDRIYAAGGQTERGVSDKFFVLDYAHLENGWKELPHLPKPLSNTVMVKSGDEIFLIGGRRAQPDGVSILYSSVYAYDLDGGGWTEKSSLPYKLSAGTGISLDDNRILLFGGDRGETFHKTELLIRDINNEPDSAKKAQLTKGKNELQRNHPGFSKTLLLYNAEEDLWENVGEIPFTTPVTTNVVRDGNEFIITSGEIRAGIRTPVLLTGKIK